MHARNPLTWSLVALSCLSILVGTSTAYERYSFDKTDTPADNAPFYNGCRTCHGDFNSGEYAEMASGIVWTLSGSPTNLMEVHKEMMNSDCDVCHSSGPKGTVRLSSSLGGTNLEPIACSGCHGRAGDGSGSGVEGYGAGLRQHHWNANRTVEVELDTGEFRQISTRICGDCHNVRADLAPLTDADPANFTPVGEDIQPPYMGDEDGTSALPALPQDPCNDPDNALFPEEDIAGDTTGLDNDGDGMTDLDDTDCGAVVASPGETSGPSLALMSITTHNAGAQLLSLAYGVSCIATDNAIVFGPLGDVGVYGYTGASCSVGNSGTVANWDYSAAPDSFFFLMVANNGSAEGSYGTRTGGTERPSDDLLMPPVCSLPRDLANRCD